MTKPGDVASLRLCFAFLKVNECYGDSSTTINPTLLAIALGLVLLAFPPRIVDPDRLLNVGFVRVREIDLDVVASAAPIIAFNDGDRDRGLFDGYHEIASLPLPAVFPEECKDDLAADNQRFCGQIEMLEIPSAIFRVAVVAGLPMVEAPTHHGRFHHQNSQLFPAGHRARLIVEAPVEVCRGYFIHQVSFHRLRRLIEDSAVGERPPQLDVFRVRPHQRARRT